MLDIKENFLRIIFSPGNMSLRRRFPVLPAVCLLSGLLAAQAAGQSFWRKNDRNTFIRNIQFNFNIPSARAVGLGGAFVAIADDATAGMANPAGLTILTMPEVSAHFKESRFKHVEFAGNELQRDLRKEFKNDVGSQSYLSLVYPHGKFAFSLYRQELINFESSYAAPGFGSVFDYPLLDPDEFALGNNTRSDIQVNNWGLAFAYQPTRYLSLGISNITSTLEFRFIEDLFQQQFQKNRPDRIFSVASNSSDVRYSVNFGLKFEPLQLFSFGAVYRSGPRFNIVNSIEDVRVYDLGRTNILKANQGLVFKVPDVYSFGVALRPLESLTLSLDMVRVEYSDLIKGLDRNLNEDDRPVSIPDFPYSRWVDSDGVQDLVLDDGTELHFGVEYFMTLGRWQIPVRAGFYTDPSHVVHTTIESEALQPLFPRGRDEIHGTFGLGFVLQNKIQLDTAVNFSRSVSEFLLSAVFRF